MNSKSLDGSCCKKMFKKGLSNHQMDSNGIKWLCSPTSESQVLPSDSRACGFKMHAVDFDHDGDLDLILGQDKRSIGVLFEHISPPRYFERISPGEVIERQSPNPIAGMITKNESVRLQLGTSWNLIGFVVSCCSQIASELIITIGYIRI